MTASTAIGSIAPEVKVNGQDLADQTMNELIGMKVSTGLRIPGRAVLRFIDEGYTIATAGSFALGTKVSIGLSDGTNLFAGEVTGVNLETTRGAPELSVVVDDLAYKMTLGNKVTTYANMTFSDIVTQIAGTYGLTATVDATSTTYKYLIQSDSDFGFVSEMADRIGYDWWVDVDGALHFCKAAGNASAVSLDWTTGLLSFSVRASALHPGAVTATGWLVDGKQTVVANSAATATQPDASLVTPFLTASALTSQSKAVSAFDSFNQAGEGQALADRTVARWSAGAVTASGTSTIAPTMKVGGKVQIGGVGPANGNYFVTEVEHVYTGSGLQTRFTAGDRRPTALVDTLSGTAPSSFRRDGLMIGIVTALSDGSSGPKGNVKVKFPTLGDQVESEWARVVSVGGGASRGMTFLPEVNDEVIVGFEGGDVTRPVVIGGLYNGKDAALDFGTLNGTIAKRQIVSRLGHVIELGDGTAPADQHIGLTLAGGEHVVQVGKDALTAKVPSGVPVSVQSGDNGFQIDKQGNITLTGIKVTIKATQDVEISGLNVTLKATSKLAGSGAQVQMQGTMQAELSSSGQTAVKGSVVMIN